MPNKRKPPVKKAIQPQVAYSSEEDEAGGFTVTGAEAVLGSDGAPPASAGEALPRELPCTLNGINAGLGGGALGYVFGFGSQLIKHRGKGRFKACTREGWSSAKTFAIMGGLYAGVNCFMKRLRQKDDAFNGAASGCATGLVLAWGGTPKAMLQSAVGFGFFSFVMDYVQGMDTQPANAAVCNGNQCQRVSARKQQKWRMGCSSCTVSDSQHRRSGPAPLQQLLLQSTHQHCDSLLVPALQWLLPPSSVAPPL